MRFVVQRLVSMVPVLVGIALIAFVLLRLVPGDVADVQLGEQNDPQIAAQLRRTLGTDRPIMEQLADWTGHLTQGDLATAYRAYLAGREGGQP